jgi:predicted site-specific integrase-resolvase
MPATAPPEARGATAPPRRLVQEDVAKIFNVAVSTVARWRKLGLIPPGMRIGKRVTWSEEEITGLSTPST